MKIETFKIQDWDDEETGLIIAENKNWILVRHIPTDYIIDGYKVYAKTFIEKREPIEKSHLTEKVFKLRNVKIEKPKDFEFTTTIGLLRWSEQKYGQVEFQDEAEKELIIGKINYVRGDTLILDFIKVNGYVDQNYNYEFSINDIRVIGFETDYFNAVKLLREHFDK